MADRPIEAAIWPEVERLFERARSLGPAERQAFLDAECGSDAALREHLERLLAAHDRLTALDPDAAFVTSLDAARASALLEEALPEPDTIGRFEVIRRIGRGGMGVIYLARDPALDRRLAVKLLPMALGADPAATRRFFDEARAASALDHPNIATVFEIGRTDDERPFIAMAYYEGETLRERLERGPLDVAEAAEIAAQVADGLAAAHGVGIVHRDIKPANLIVTRSGLVKILDFGVARTASVALTRTGATVGTVAYMSPEQTRGERVDGRADIWALGVVLYEMLAGTRPFRSDAHDAIVYAIRNDSPEPLRSLRAEVPPALEAIVERCLTKGPAGRFASAAELAHALREAVGGAAAGLGAAAAARTVRGGAAAGHAGAPTVVPVNLAMAGYFRGRADEALAILDSISTAPDGSRAPNPFSENLRARLLGAEERWDEAERVALDVLDRFRDSPHVRSEASRTLWHLALVQGRLEEAERYFRSTVETYEAIGALDALARAHIQRADTRLHLLGDTVGARATLAHVLERPGFDLLAVGPTLAPRAAAVLAGIGDTATAARLIEEWEMLPIGRRSEPDGYSPEIARARIDLAAGRPIDAIERLEREATHGLQAINLLPDLGRAYHEAGQIEAAIDAMERYLEVRHVRKLHRIPGYLGPVLIRLADLYEATGNTEKAQEMHARLNSLWHAADPALGAQAELAGRRIAELSRLRAP